jgi:hypothetical protein
MCVYQSAFQKYVDLNAHANDKMYALAQKDTLQDKYFNWENPVSLFAVQSASCFKFLG